jgi:hypothetical protein
MNTFNDKRPDKHWATSALPGLAKVGKSADYLAAIAPRPILLTRGTREWAGHPDGERRSAEHVQETVELERYARERYTSLNAGNNLRVIYFRGGHAFPFSVKGEAYHWLDGYLNPQQWQQEELTVQRLDALCTQAKQQGKELALRCFLPPEKQDHIRRLISMGGYGKATGLIDESEKQIRSFDPHKIRQKNVAFILSAPDAKEVYLAGSFNGWNPTADRLTKQKNGTWAISKSLSTGIHCYKFVADGEWFVDPQNREKYYNAEGGENSVVVVSNQEQ